MPRKNDPRWSEIVPRNPPIFLIEDAEAKTLAQFVGLSGEEDITAMKAAVEEIGGIYFARRAQAKRARHGPNAMKR